MTEFKCCGESFF